MNYMSLSYLIISKLHTVDILRSLYLKNGNIRCLYLSRASPPSSLENPRQLYKQGLRWLEGRGVFSERVRQHLQGKVNPIRLPEGPGEVL